MSLKIIRNNIINVSADAIVNTANPKPTYVSGVDKAIYNAAGAKKLLKERKKIGEIAVGKAEATPAFGLSARYIIHTVGPVWQGGDCGERESVRSCYEESLKLAKKLGCVSIAFPLIATGVYGFPKAEALSIAISVFSEFLTENEMEIILVVFDETAFVLSDRIFSGVESFIDKNYVEVCEDEEYGEAADRTARCPGDIPGERFLESEIKETPDSHGDKRRNIRKKVLSMPFGSALKKSSSMARNESMACEDSMPDDILADEGVPAEKTFAMASVQMASSLPKQLSLDDRVAHLADTWQESLFRLIDEKGYTDTEVYKRANIDRKLFSKIRSNASYQPKKITAVAFALALKLNLDETKDFLGRAGYAFSPSSLFDLIVEYFIEQEVYDTYTINLALFKHEQPLLGD